ncbi:hypothetical protein CK203_063499 [Vitis vinifera]|uniref:G-patch domain-containing protein n=1 Tax=Vitis vinifera TaxID=29760 RepID=A0A438G6S7_VITVI|nr:hypothetical protein CK203_063499 [Vitis vinifera]
MARDHSAWLGTTASRAGPVDRVRVHKLATPLGIEPRISGFIRRSSLNLSWVPELRFGLEIKLVRGSNPHSQLEQIPDHRDMDPQYATVDQLAEITDTMASLRDAILGLGQRIDGHQAKPLPILGSTLHDSTTPPPPPPPPRPSEPTIQQDYIVPPPPVQSASQAGAFVLHSRTETTPHSVVAPAQIVDDTQALAALPVEFRMPDIERYTGIGCPRIHLQLPSMAFEEGISRGLWADSSHSDSKGKKPGSGPRPSNVGTIGLTGHRFAHRPPFQSQCLGTPYQMMQHDRYRPVVPIRPAGTTYLHPPPQPVYTTQAPQRPPMQFHHQYRALPPPTLVRTVHIAWDATEPSFSEIDLHYAYHQRAGHDTDSCLALRHAIQDLIDQGLVDLGRPGVATDPLPTHDTRAVPPPPEGVHLIEFTWDEIFMMGWDGEAPQPISLYEESNFVGYIPRQQIPRPFKEYRPPHRDVQIVTRSGRVAQPPPVDKPYAGIAVKEEVQREDDEILCQLRTTQARISIWSLLASSSTHRDALVRALGQIRVDTATTPKGLIHMLTVDRATCIVFSDDDLPPEGSNHVRPLFIDVVVSGRSGVVCSAGQWFCPERFSSSFNLLLGRPWIHEAGAIPSSLHQKVVSLEMVVEIWYLMSLDQHNSTLVLSMMRGMSYLPGMGLGRRQGSEHTPRTEGTVRILETVEIQDIQQALGQMHLDTGTTETPGAMIVAVSSIQPHAGPILLSICSEFLYLRFDEDDSIPDAYTDDMDFVGIGRILDVASRGPHSAFDIFGVFVLDDESVLDVVTSDFTSVEGASDSVDPSLSSDTMSGFVTHFDDISDDNNDMSIFEYLTVS